jgi:flagellar L-ring protein precursor FlgH
MFNSEETKMKILNFKIVLSLITISLVLSGCSSAPQRMEKFSYEPAYPVNIPQSNLPKNGSLYHAGDSLSLFDATRAHKVGDIITIKLNENFNAKKKDEAKYNKSNSQDYGVSTPLTLFGQAIV